VATRRRDLTERVTLVGVSVAALVAVVVVLQGMSTASVATAENPPPTSAAPAPTTVSPPAASPTTVSPPAGVRLATAVYDLRTGTFVSRSGENAVFPAESLTKLLIATDLAASGRLAGDTVPKVQRMLSTSDDQAANQLWTGDGGPRIVSRAIRAMGLRETAPPRDPGRWGDTTTTAADIVRIYQYVLKMPAAQRNALLTDLAATPKAADGTDQDFGITAAVPAGQWWVKQAWACCRPAWDVHTTGLVGPDRRYVVVALSEQPVAGGFGGAAKVLTDVARNLVSGLGIDGQVAGGA
jgi:beta-lactamase class A